MMEQTQQIAPKKRLLALDVLRGMTIAGMILVNNGGGKEIFEPLRHSHWNGLSIADMVFPFFLFMVGISTFISLRKFNFQISSALVHKILKRTIIMLLIGWGIYYFGYCCEGNFLPFDKLRIPGVLQRIAICYCVVSLLSVSRARRYFLWIAAALLIIYSVLLIIGNGYDCSSSNILAIVDNAIFGKAHLYTKSPIDPEGLLGIIPSVAHTMIGFWFGSILMEKKALEEKMLDLFIPGFSILIIGLLLNYGMPMNKRIWSPSFVLVTCGIGACLQSLLIHFIDRKGSKSTWTAFFESFGVNPLFLYVFSELLAIVFDATGLKHDIYTMLHAIILNGYMASLVYAIIFVLICWAVGYILYKKRIYIKI